MADRVETIGIYSAYGFAREAGYTGTKAEFEQGLKNSAEYAGNAAASAASANNAKTAAQNAQNAASQFAESAANSASEASQSAEDAAASAAALTIDKTLSQENVAADSKAVGEALNRKADVDGFYEEMSVGTAEQLNSTQKVQDSEPYLFRTSGGSADIGNREELTIVGGSVVWNQNVNAVYVPSGETNGIIREQINVGNKLGVHVYGEATVTDNYSVGLVRNGYFISGHVYLHDVGCNLPSGCKISTGKIDGQSSTVTMINVSTAVLIAAGTTIDFVAYPQAFDLTKMFGSEIADYIYGLEQAETGAGVAWFRKYFPNDYYEYNAGEMMSVNDLQSHDTVGFNQWDEEWEPGVYSPSTGEKTVWNGYIRFKNYMRVLPDTAYYKRTEAVGFYWHLYYDANKNFLGTEGVNANRVFTTPKNAHYMTSYTETAYGATYKNDTVFNLVWSGGRNGEYKSGQKHSYPLDSSLTLRGIPKLDANNNLYFDGDTYAPDGTVTRKYGIVDLGTLGWRYNETHSMFYATLSGTQPFFNFNGICSKYVRTKSANGSPSSGNTEWGSSAFIGSGFNLLIRDSAYTDAATFKAAMSGVYLVYELAEPTTEEAAPYTSPQIVDDWGTEEFVTSSIVPVGHNTSYPANLRDKLQHLPSLPDSDGYYMTQVTGTQMGMVRFRIPQAPATDGTYVLKATVSNGTPTYTWVDENAEEVTEP